MKLECTGFTRQTKDSRWRSTIVHGGKEYVGPVMDSSRDAEHAALHVFIRSRELAIDGIELTRVLDFSACACAEVRS
jgi:hypothetical protein